MPSLTAVIETLESRRDAMTKELAEIDRQLATIARTLGNPRSNGHARPATRSMKVRTTKTGRHGWFARGEAPELLRKAARRAGPAADLVRALGAAKGYDEALSQDQYRRFETAAFMAVNHAVKAGVLKRRRDGMLVSS